MFYPVFLNLHGRRAVMIGGGEVAERKVRSLMDSGASITLITPSLTPHLRALGAAGAITIAERPYFSGDCRGAFLVICATDDVAVQKAVWKEAEELGVLVNTVDDPVLCNAIMPAVVRQGDLTLAISTGGKSPALAVRLRERFAQLIGPEYGRLLELLGRIRPMIRQRSGNFEVRKDIHYRIVDSNVLDLLKANDEAAAERRVREIIDEFDHEGVPR